MREYNSDSKMQIRGIGDLLHPGCCAVCGSGTCVEGYIDTSIYYDYEGRVYFCMTCAEELAEVAGCLTSTETTHLQTTNEQLAAENHTLTIALDEANEQLTKLNSVIRSALGNRPDVSIGFMADSPIDEALADDAEPVESGVAEPVSKGTRSRPRLTKSVAVGGSNDPERDELFDGSGSGGLIL